MNRPAQPAKTRVVRVWWLTLGCFAVGVGSVGIIVPGLPTTVFFIVAAWCFSRSSPRFEQWVLTLPRIGPLVADHRAGLGMPRRAKILALAMMWIAITLSAYALRDRPWIVGIVAALGLIGTAYICWRIPTRVEPRSQACREVRREVDVSDR
jgi:uncharacterized membrane protein YbaN (DUF454 family)